MKGREVGAGDSLPLGGLRLQAGSGGSLKAARDLVRSALDQSQVIRRLERRTFYAIGGTWRSLARLHMHDSGYPLHVMHEYRMDPDELDDFLKVLIRGPLDQVPGIAVVSRQRQALLPFGAVVLAEVLQGRQAELGFDLGARSSRRSAVLETVGQGAEGRPADLRRVRAQPAALALAGAWRGADPLDRRRHGRARPRGDRRGEAAARRGLPARRYRLARASRLSRRAEPEHHHQRRLRRHRPSRPRLSGARHLLPPRRADGGGARRRAPRARAAPLSRERTGARRRVPRRLSRLRRGRRASCRGRTIRQKGNSVELVLPGESRRSARRAPR